MAQQSKSQQKQVARADLVAQSVGEHHAAIEVDAARRHSSWDRKPPDACTVAVLVHVLRAPHGHVKTAARVEDDRARRVPQGRAAVAIGINVLYDHLRKKRKKHVKNTHVKNVR